MNQDNWRFLMGVNIRGQALNEIFWQPTISADQIRIGGANIQQDDQAKHEK